MAPCCVAQEVFHWGARHFPARSRPAPGAAVADFSGDDVAFGRTVGEVQVTTRDHCR